jgi:hypothetical protein
MHSKYTTISAYIGSLIFSRYANIVLFCEVLNKSDRRINYLRDPFNKNKTFTLRKSINYIIWQLLYKESSILTFEQNLYGVKNLF